MLISRINRETDDSEKTATLTPVPAAAQGSRYRGREEQSCQFAKEDVTPAITFKRPLVPTGRLLLLALQTSLPPTFILGTNGRNPPFVAMVPLTISCFEVLAILKWQALFQEMRVPQGSVKIADLLCILVIMNQLVHSTRDLSQEHRSWVTPTDPNLRTVCVYGDSSFLPGASLKSLSHPVNSQATGLYLPTLEWKAEVRGSELWEECCSDGYTVCSLSLRFCLAAFSSSQKYKDELTESLSMKSAYIDTYALSTARKQPWFIQGLVLCLWDVHSTPSQHC